MSSDFRLAYPTDNDPNTLFACLQNIVSLLNGNSKFASPIDLSKYTTPGEAVVKLRNSAPSSPTATFLDKNGNIVFQTDSEGNVTGPNAKPIATSENTQTLKNKTLNVSDSNTFSGITGAMLSATAGITAAQLASGVLFDMKSFLVTRATNQVMPNGANDISFSSIVWQPSGSTVWSGGAPSTVNVPASGKWVFWVLLNNDISVENNGAANINLIIDGAGQADIIRYGIGQSADTEHHNMGGTGIFMTDCNSGDSVVLRVNTDKGPGSADMEADAPVYLGGFRVRA